MRSLSLCVVACICMTIVRPHTGSIIARDRALRSGSLESLRFGVAGRSCTFAGTSASLWRKKWPVESENSDCRSIIRSLSSRIVLGSSRDSHHASVPPPIRVLEFARKVDGPQTACFLVLGRKHVRMVHTENREMSQLQGYLARVVKLDVRFVEFYSTFERNEFRRMAFCDGWMKFGLKRMEMMKTPEGEYTYVK